MKFFERIGPNGELFAPTISPAIEYDADQDAEILRDAMSGVGTNEEDIISIFTNRNYEQRKAIESAYESSFGRSLRDDIKSEVNGHLEVALLALLMSSGEIRAEACHEALSGGGTDEVSLARIIGSATNDEIEDMKESYLRLYEKDLIEAINGDCSGDFSRILIALLQANRIEPSEEQMRAFETDGISALVDHERAEELQHKLYEAGDGAWGTDEDTFIMILCRQSVWMIAAIDHYYQQNVSKSIIEAIESEFGGDEENILKNIVQGSLDRPTLYAKLLHDTMKGAGTNEKALIQLITMRAEIDLQTIKEVYETKYEESLLEKVKSEVSGDLENILTALIEP